MSKCRPAGTMRAYGLDNICNCKNSRSKHYFTVFQTSRITGPIDSLVMLPDYFCNGQTEMDLLQDFVAFVGMILDQRPFNLVKLSKFVEYICRNGTAFLCHGAWRRTKAHFGHPVKVASFLLSRRPV